MPEYSFICEDCGTKFSIFMSYSKYDEGRFTCSKCNSVAVHRDHHTDLSDMVGSIRKSDSELKTVGDIADRNRDRMSNDEKEHLSRKHNGYKLDKADDPLPQGWNRVRKTKKVKWTKK